MKDKPITTFLTQFSVSYKFINSFPKALINNSIVYVFEFAFEHP
ncbi:hypothetical protein METHP14_30067 [Pseudomonas sp. P14-2025]